jgi:hypothetical protein
MYMGSVQKYRLNNIWNGKTLLTKALLTKATGPNGISSNKEHYWDFTNRRSKITQIALPWSRVKDVLAELHGGQSGGYLGVSKTLNKVRQETVLRSGASCATPAQLVAARALCNSTTSGG